MKRLKSRTGSELSQHEKDDVNSEFDAGEKQVENAFPVELSLKYMSRSAVRTELVS